MDVVFKLRNVASIYSCIHTYKLVCSFSFLFFVYASLPYVVEFEIFVFNIICNLMFLKI